MNVVLRPILVAVLLLCTGCASTVRPDGTINKDPYEDINRSIFVFNDGLDRNVVAPLSRGYRTITPNFVERGFRNFFANLWDINSAVNALLQGRFKEAGQNTGRFVVNSTVGLFGTLDVASEMGITLYRTDFGHTLALWGFDSGPYLMVPFFGPRTVRSGTGFIFDTVVSVQYLMMDRTPALVLYALEIIDNRAALTDAEGLITGDRYLFIRDVYMQQRESFVNDGAVQDSFSDYEEEFDWDE